MRIFRLSRPAVRRRDFFTAGNPVDSPWFFLPWNQGSSLGSVPVPVRYELDRDRPLPDYVNTAGSQLLVSPRLLALIRALSPEVEWFPSLIEFGRRIISGDHLTVNFTRAHACMDWHASRYQPSGVPGVVLSCDELVIRRSDVPPHGLFLMREMVEILANETGRDELDRAGVTGVCWEPLRVSE